MVGIEPTREDCVLRVTCNPICIRLGADDGARTRDILLGKQTFYH